MLNVLIVINKISIADIEFADCFSKSGNSIAKQCYDRSRKIPLRQDREFLRAVSTQNKPVGETARTLVFTITNSTVNGRIQASKFSEISLNVSDTCAEIAP